MSGIYAGDPEQISVPAAFPKLFALEQKYGSLIRGQIIGARERRKSAETSKNTAKSFSFARGMKTVPEALAARIARLERGVRVESIAPRARRLRRDAERSAACRCASPRAPSS